MVVEDQPDLLQCIISTLQGNGYQVHAFEDSIKALEHIEQEHCNLCGLLVTDIRMRAMGGMELAKRVKKLKPEMKIILATAFEVRQNEWQKALPSTQIDGFITKPYTVGDLVDAIKKCVSEAS